MAEVRSYSPTLRERMAAALMGDKPSQPRRDFVSGLLGSTGLGSTGMGLADLTPLGVPMAVQESYRAGDPQGMALAAAPFGVAAKVPQGVVKALEKGIRAYHGSPHDFDRFNMSKIGTGEGAQAYGHGLYFAENPKTAQNYRDALSNEIWNVGGKPYDAKNPEHFAGALLTEFGGDPENAIKNIRAAIAQDSKINSDWARLSVAQMEDAIKRISRGVEPVTTTSQGRMYEVSINATPEQFLDWDKPLAGQPVASNLAPFLSPDTPAGRQLGFTTEFLKHPPSGQSAYRALGIGMEDATAKMREAGIPGIKYLDQGSRGTGQGTSNYVLFRDDIIDILRKYGLAGAAPTGLAAALLQGQEQ